MYVFRDGRGQEGKQRQIGRGREKGRRGGETGERYWEMERMGEEMEGRGEGGEEKGMGSGGGECPLTS